MPARAAVSSDPPPDPLAQYNDLFDAAAREWNVDPALLRAVARQESQGNPRATSTAYPYPARGLMQIIDPTAKGLGVTDPYDPAQSIFGGAKYLNEALTAENNNPNKALLYYHGGPNWRNKMGPESRDYVPAVAGYYATYSRAATPANDNGAPVKPAAVTTTAPATTPAPSPAKPGAAPSLDDLNAVLGPPAGSTPASGTAAKPGAAPTLDDLNAVLGPPAAPPPNQAKPPGPVVQPAHAVASLDPEATSQFGGDIVAGGLSGLRAAVRGGARTLTGGATTDQPLAQQTEQPPESWPGRIAYNVAYSSPALAGSALGAAGGEALGGPLGAVAGGAAGMSLVSAAQALAPAYDAARARGLDHDAALEEAYKMAVTSGVGGLASGGLAVLAPFKGVIGKLLFQGAAVQPAVGATQRLVGGEITGQPVTPSDLARGYVEDVATGAALTGAHALAAGGATAVRGAVAAETARNAAAQAARETAARDAMVGGVNPLDQQTLQAAQTRETIAAARRGEEAPSSPVPGAAAPAAPVPSETPGAAQPVGAQVSPSASIHISPAEEQAYRSTAEGQKWLERQEIGKPDRTQYIEGENPNTVELEQQVADARELKNLGIRSEPASQAAKEAAAFNNEKREQHLQRTVESSVDTHTLEQNRQDAWNAAEPTVFTGKNPDADIAPIVQHIEATLNTPTNRQNTQMKADYAPLLKRLVNEDGTPKITDPHELYGLRQDISRMTDKRMAADNPNLHYIGGELKKLMTVIDGQIEPVAPGYRKMLDDYRDASRRIDELRVLQDAEKGLYDNRGGHMVLSYNKMQNFMRKVIDARRTGPADQNPYKAISPEKMEQLWALRDSLRRSASALELARTPGSDTAQNLWDMAKGLLKGEGEQAITAFLTSHLGAPGYIAARIGVPIVKGIASGRAAQRDIARAHEMLNPNIPLNPLAGP